MASKNTDQSELIDFIRRHLVGTIATIIVFFALAGLLVMHFEAQIVGATQWIDTHFGFWGLSAILFVGDSVVSPVPPDILMLIISKGPMKEHWVFYVFCFGCISALAGINGFYIGKYLANQKWATRWVESFQKENAETVKKYGFWAVAIGALTPFPFSVTCWSAGFLGLDLPRMVAASLLRIPRFFVYYFAIDYGAKIIQLF